ncbi:MAG: metallophosphoesterase family protein, partial [Candidatus Bilamarchaeaceae archaeon]
IHGEEEALSRLRESVSRYDYVLIAGDIGGGPSFLEGLLSISENIYWVPGNSEELDSPGKHPRCLHRRRMEIAGGFNIVGFGFTPPTPFGTPGEMQEEEIYAQMKGLPIDGKTILLTHAPPYGILDEVEDGLHAGSRAVQRIMEKKGPLLLACGHIHDVEGKQKVGETTVVQIPEGRKLRGVVLEIREGHVSIKMGRL